MDAQSYLEQRENLMKRWNEECYQWVNEECQICNGINSKVKFFKDGVIDAEEWFNGDDLRVLFILKEPHDIIDEKTQDNYDGNVSNYLSLDFVAMEELPDCDIWNGKPMWRGLGALAKGILDCVGKNEKLPEYKTIYEEDIEEYRSVLRKIAIMNIKKLSSGGNTDSCESMLTKNYTCHAGRFKNNIQEQIKMIDPDVIICCGKADVAQHLDVADDKLYGIPTVVGYHPSINKDIRRKQFYNETIEKVKYILSDYYSKKNI